MNPGDIFWTRVKILDYEERIVPYYFTRQVQSAVYGIIARNMPETCFGEQGVFKSVDQARVATGVNRVFCFQDSSAEHFSIVSRIHQTEGLMCPHCGPGTAIVELSNATYFCFANHKNISGKARANQVTLGQKNGCANYIELDLHQSQECVGCDCGSPYVGHVPKGSYCWKTLDMNRKYL